MKNLVKANSIGPDYANNMAGTFKKNLLPLIPNGLLLTEVTQELIEGWILELVKLGKISKNTINSIIKSMSVALGEAVRRGNSNQTLLPTSNILTHQTQRKKGYQRKRRFLPFLTI
ncbi:MAG: hypothetical protein ACI4NI_11665 [Candidatus Ornithospirochaeta sp.]